MWVHHIGFQLGAPQIGSQMGPQIASRIGSQMGCPKLAHRWDGPDRMPHIGAQMEVPQIASQMERLQIGSKMGRSSSAPR